MFTRFLRSKILILFTVLFFVGFIAGYDYAIVTSKEIPETSVKAPLVIPYDEPAPSGTNVTDEQVW